MSERWSTYGMLMCLANMTMTQLYFPNEPANRRDGLFRRELVMRITAAPNGFAAHFDFVIDIR